MNCFIHSKALPTLLLIRVAIFGLTVPKLCQILLLHRGCARIQRHLIGLVVDFLQSLSNREDLRWLQVSSNWNGADSGLAGVSKTSWRLPERRDATQLLAFAFNYLPPGLFWAFTCF